MIGGRSTRPGAWLERLPEGMVVRDLVTHTDERGTVAELYDPRWGVSPDALVLAYTSTIRPGMATGCDKYRLALDTDERPVKLGPGWRGS